MVGEVGGGYKPGSARRFDPSAVVRAPAPVRYEQRGSDEPVPVPIEEDGPGRPGDGAAIGAAEILRAGPMPQRLVDEAQRRADEWWNDRLNAKQKEALNSGVRELMVCGDNRIGKSLLLQLLVVWWSQQIFPRGYTGLRLPDLLPILCLGETQVTTRDTFQEPLIGMVDRVKHEIIPTGITRDGFDSLISPEWAYFGRHALRTSGLLQLFFVRCATGGAVPIMFGTYGERTRARKGYNFGKVLVDESGGGLPGYMEAQGRLVKSRGPTRIAWCPIINSDGENDLYDYFDQSSSPDRLLLRYTIQDATHLGREAIADRIAQISGTAEEQPRLWGRKAVVGGKTFARMDHYLREFVELPPTADREIIGYDFPHTMGCFAAVHLLWDDKNDVVYPVNEYQDEGLTPQQYADCVIERMQGNRIIGAWPADGNRERGVGTADDTLKDEYEKAGLNLLFSAAAYVNEDGSRSRSVVRAIQDARRRLAEGRLILSRSRTPKLVDAMDSHRLDKNGKPVKGMNDHLVDALFKAIMQLPESRPVGSGGPRLSIVKHPFAFAAGVDRSTAQQRGVPGQWIEEAHEDESRVGLSKLDWRGRVIRRL